MEVVTRIARVNAHLGAEMQDLFKRHDLSAADFQVIAALRRRGRPFQMTQAQLMTQLALTSGTVSVRVDRLVRRGVVVREADPSDARSQIVRLTAEGLTLFDEIAPVHLANEERMLSALTADEQEMLAGLLRRLLGSFESGGVEASRLLGMRLEAGHVARTRRQAVGLSDTPGLLVAHVLPGTPAAQAGLARGDLLVAVDGRELRAHATLAEAVQAAPPGKRLRLSVLRGDEPRQVRLAVERE
ncbi:MAG: PDZ domain-containing protein [Acidimicrobiaceae bacterium]|nr:PDZ domain-containing protein [Acidimicrobiaceae bacterium]